jgi:hypothetical protein
LKAPLEGTRDNQIELNIQSIQHIGELEAVLFAFFVERTLEVEYGILAAKTSTGVAKNI